ncbi:DUF3037 domain-containing protein [Prosthecomicrobium hirschii]|uniref:DUF3037 domain-containing protein n=1 Tax=Prosthecodimorpha hirschii TaxID=665126 RepID=UPI00221F6614|nr:DUF3037 domain-containing protein [Prosthecomicrobium hirschii]MCW1843456.1 DUF3037 domain-containing protein [Prosthecomicrobium hirschii]
MDMRRMAFRYKIIRFMPFAETAEFANIGVVAVSQDAGFFDYRLKLEAGKRVLNFFGNLDPDIYTFSVKRLAAELERIKRTAPNSGLQLSLFKSPDLEWSFDELTRPREGVFDFGSQRLFVCENLSEGLSVLFSYYVKRSFLSNAYREQILEREVRESLKSASLDNRFKPERLADGAYEVEFPFVEAEPKLGAGRVIKPLHLGQRDPTRIIDHGAKWRYAVERLRKHGKLNATDAVLFPVEGPTDASSENFAWRIEAYTETVDALRASDIQVVSVRDHDKIVEFAKTKHVSATEGIAEGRQLLNLKPRHG